MSENTTKLCPTCVNSIFCPTWAEQKCKVKGQRIYNHETLTECESYKKRPKDFKDPKCRCEDCLKTAGDKEK